MKQKRLRYLLTIILIISIQSVLPVQAQEKKAEEFRQDNYVYTVTKKASKNVLGEVTINVKEQKKDAVTEVTIPQKLVYNNLVYQVKSIGNSAFNNCKNLTKVTIPDSVKSINKMAFGKCSSLTSVLVADSVVNIAEDAFSDCSPELVISCSTGSKAYEFSVKKELKYKEVSAKESSSVGRKLIIVGDSRTHNMSKWVIPSVPTQFVAKSGQGYQWFIEEGISSVNLLKNPGDVIVVWLGVNDYFSTALGQKSWQTYGNKLNSLATREWSDCKVYVGAVGYVDKAKMKTYYGYVSRSNSTVVKGTNGLKGIGDYNKKLKSVLSKKITWIDTFRVIGIKNNDTDKTSDEIWLTREDGRKDGLHYSKAKTQEIYDYFVKSAMKN